MQGHKLFWGEIHTHTNLSDGNGSPEDNLERVGIGHYSAETDPSYSAVPTGLVEFLGTSDTQR